MDSIDILKTPKKHRASKSGAKAKKKVDNSKKKRGLSNERYNPKAFSVANIGRTKRTTQRNLDKEHKKEVVAQAEGENSELTDGEALVAVAVETGNFPPSLTVGDVVRVIVTPNSTGVGEVHGLTDTTIVHSVSPPSDIGSQFVVTLRAPATAATAIAASGPIHLAIIGMGPK